MKDEVGSVPPNLAPCITTSLQTRITYSRDSNRQQTGSGISRPPQGVGRYRPTVALLLLSGPVPNKSPAATQASQ